MQGSRVLLVLPVFDDWAACWTLMEQLDETFTNHKMVADVLLVDDGSEHPAPAPPTGFHSLTDISVLELKLNVGHQRAICLGLCHVEAHLDADVIVVLDADGEDSPADVPRLLEEFERQDESTIVFAERRKRSENRVFRVCYFLYRWLHWILTGHQVRVGNFSVIPRASLRRLVLAPAMWSHYAAAVFNSKLRYSTLPTARARRLDGQSKMNFVALVTHGLTAISVFSERVGVRLLLATISLGSTLAFSMAMVFGVRLFTTWAIPGWATYTCGLLAVILLQCLVGAMLFCFMILSARNRLDFLPARDFSFFIARHRSLFSASQLYASSADE